MVLRCSLLGHEYGESDVEREREERGSEVVVTVREYEECARCGTRNVVSENTEVTSLETGPDGVDRHSDGEFIEAHGAEGVVDDHGDGGETLGGDPSDDEEVPLDESSDDGVIIEDGVDQSTPDSDTPPVGVDDDAASTLDEIEVRQEETGESIVDDGEILEADDEIAGDRAHGEWPESPDVGPPLDSKTEPSAWPEDEREVEVEESGEAEHHVEEEQTIGDTTETQPAGESSRETDVVETGFASAGSVPAPGESTSPQSVVTELFCPQCSFAAPGDRGSLRPGDICPECRRGYLGERER